MISPRRAGHKRPTRSDESRAAVGWAIVGGILTAQIIGTAQVWLATRALFDKTIALAAAGYLTVPNAATRPMLLSFKTALVGGFFFTLTIGALLVAATVSLVYLGRLTTLPDRLKHTLAGLIFGAGIVLPNLSGLNVGATLHLAAAPAVVWFFLRRSTAAPGWPQMALRGVPLVIIGVLLVTTAGGDIFITVRDRLLLTNPVGRMINATYYRYTPAAVAVIEPLRQKLMRACRIEPAEATGLPESLACVLTAQDYLPVEEARRFDVALRVAAGGRLTFVSESGASFETRVSQLTAHPAETLAAVSDAFDHQRVFRKLLLWGLLLGLPTLLYGLIFLGLETLFKSWLSAPAAVTVAALLMCAAGLVLVLSLRPYAVPDGRAGLGAALNSDSGRRRVAALRKISEKGMDLSAFDGYADGVTSPLIAERYWTARALAAGNGRQTGDHLRRLLADSQTNVVCMALQSLGRSGEGWAVAIVKAHLNRSTHWYEQIYAYKALRRLGWVQTVSP